MDGLHDVFVTRHRDRDKKRLAVLNTAAELFLSKGYNRTLMNDVANILNITKPALYNYFRSKHEILFACHMLGHDIIEQSIEEIENGDGNGLFQLRALIRAYANIMMQKFGMCLILLDVHELPLKDQKAITRRRRLVNDGFERFIQQGIDDGSIKPCNVRLTAFSIAGSLNWISRWYKSDRMYSGDQIADYFSEDLTRGLAVEAASADKSPAGVKTLVRATRKRRA